MVKVRKFHIENVAGEKAKCQYFSFTDSTTKEPCIKILAKEYGDQLGKILGYEVVENNTDTMTDYFERDRAILTKSHPYFMTFFLAIAKYKGR